jgi:hypothetical protein
MARKTVLVSDVSGAEIPDGKGATIRITFSDARKGVRELDVTDTEAEKPAWCDRSQRTSMCSFPLRRNAGQ